MKDAREYLQKGEKRHCRVINVDVGKRKIGLSLLEPGIKDSSPKRSENGGARPPAGSNGRRLQRSVSRTSEPLDLEMFFCAKMTAGTMQAKHVLPLVHMSKLRRDGQYSIYM